MSVDTGQPTSAVPGLPGGTIPVATPTFSGAPVPGASGGTPDPSAQVSEMTKKLLQALAQASQRKQFAGQPQPAAVPGMRDPNAARQIGMNTANPHAWGTQRFMAGLATSIQNAVAKQKQQKLLKAESDWTYLQSGLNELYQAQASNDPKAAAAAQAKVDVVMGDPKKLKDMAKALNQDWLNPEKTTVYGEALKKVNAQTQQTDAQKQQAAQGIKGVFQKLMQRQQKPQQSNMPANWTPYGPKDAPGLVQPGNIDLTKRPVIQNADGSHSSEYSVSFGTDKGEVLVPTVVNGKFLTPDGKKPPEGSPEEKAMFQRALENYKKTGENLGVYDTPEHANAAANMIHSRDQRTQQQPGTKVGRVQLSPEQQKAMSAEVQSKAPTTTTGGTSLKDTLDAAKAVEELARAQKELRAPGAADKYDVKVIKDAQGGEKLVAIDKTNPTKPYVEIKSESGETAKPGEKKSPNEGKLEIVGGIPTGRVMHGGTYVAPTQPGYTEEDKKAVMLGMGAAGLSQQQKEKLAKVRATSFATARAANTPIAVTDNETGEAGYASMLDVARNPSKYVQPGESEKIAARDSVHRSLNANFGALAKDLDKLPHGLDTETQATIAAAMRSDSPGVIETLLVNKIKQGAPDEVLQYITDMKVMQEDILVLRNVGGMGQGSDSMRAAITRMIPGPGTSSVKEAKMQMEGAKRTSESLFKGRPEAKFSKDAADASSGMESKTYNGAVYQRKAGSKDSWTLVPPPK